jgi:hypothetical protein
VEVVFDWGPSAIATPDTPGNRDTALDSASKNSCRPPASDNGLMAG